MKGLVSYLILDLLWQLQECFDQVPVDYLLQFLIVHLTFDSAPYEKSMVAPDTVLGWRRITCHLSHSAQEVVPLIFAHLGLESFEQLCNWLYDKETSQKITFLCH